VIPPLLGTVQSTSFFFPFVMACLAVPHIITGNLRILRRYLMVSVVLPGMIGGVALLASPEDREQVLLTNTMYVSSVDAAIAYSSVPGGGRLASLTDAWEASGRGQFGRWVGLGPGASSESELNASLRNRGKLKAIVTQVDFLLTDLGLPGVLAALAIVAWAYIVNLRAFRRARSRVDRTVTFALFGIIPLFGLFFLYLGCWISDVPAFLFWLGLAYITPLVQARSRPRGFPVPARVASHPMNGRPNSAGQEGNER
jgi:hypothetical protein